MQNSGGCFPPPPGYFQRVREICDKYGVLMVSDEVICAFGRLGYMFGSERYGYTPDIITFAKGVTSGYSPLGGMMVSDRLMEPYLKGEHTFLHGVTFAGHPVSCAVALANLDVFEKEDLLAGMEAIDYVVITAGSFDLLIEVVCEDDDQLLEILGEGRSLPGVTTTETFVYLKLRKQTYHWGTR